MIRLATVFSGIGAIEHALLRMGIDYKIVFACDNGDVDILNKSIGMNIDEIAVELKELFEIIKNISFDDDVQTLYKDQLFGMLAEAGNEFNEIYSKLDGIPSFDDRLTGKLLATIISMPNIKTARKKEYVKFNSEINIGSSIQRKYYELEVILEICNDFKKDNGLVTELTLVDELKSSDNINWKSVYEELVVLYNRLESVEGKKIIRRVQDLSQRTAQLHEKINYLGVQRELEKMGNDWKAKKKYVDNLYKGLENRNKVKKSYMENYDIDEDNFHWNVCFLDGRQYQGEVDLFVGGSPCQSFSLVGKQRGLDDTRGTLFYEYARLVDEIKPKVFIYENVRAVLSNDNGKTWETMKKVFSDLGYNWHFAILNAKDYGIPQNRERIFVVGFRNDLKLKDVFDFPPQPVKLDKTMQDFLLDKVSGKYYLPVKGVNFVTSEKNLTKKYTQIDGEVALCQKKNQQFNWHGDFVFVEENHDMEKTMQDLEKYFLSEKVEKYVLSSGTKKFYSRPETDLEIARPLLTTMHKMHRAGVDNYVTTLGRLRKLTPRECLRLMGFCDSFKIVVSDTSMYQQAGNSIVVDVLIAILNDIFGVVELGS